MHKYEISPWPVPAFPGKRKQAIGLRVEYGGITLQREQDFIQKTMPLSTSFLMDRFRGSDMRKKVYTPGIGQSSLQIESAAFTDLTSHQKYRKRVMHSAHSRARKSFREVKPFTQNPSIPIIRRYVKGLTEADPLFQSEQCGSPTTSQAAVVSSQFQELADRYIYSLSDDYGGMTINPDQPATWPSCDPISESTDKNIIQTKQSFLNTDVAPLSDRRLSAVPSDVIDLRPHTHKNRSSQPLDSSKLTTGTAKIRKRSASKLKSSAAKRKGFKGRRIQGNAESGRRASPFNLSLRCSLSMTPEKQTTPVLEPSADFTPLLDTLTRIPLDILDDESSDMAVSTHSSTRDYRI